MDLFDAQRADQVLQPGAVVLAGFAAAQDAALLAEVARVASGAPFRHLSTPGGRRMSVAMTNCGAFGWVSDRTGYRYDRVDPQTGLCWPPMPAAFADLAAAAAGRAGYQDFAPDVCLINRYEPGTRLTLHQDRDEGSMVAPIVSVSLGVPAVFLWGGLRRTDRVRRVRLVHGDVAVWGGPARMVFHGVATLGRDTHPATGGLRFNLTFRTAGVSGVAHEPDIGRVGIRPAENQAPTSNVHRCRS